MVLHRSNNVITIIIIIFIFYGIFVFHDLWWLTFMLNLQILFANNAFIDFGTHKRKHSIATFVFFKYNNFTSSEQSNLFVKPQTLNELIIISRLTVAQAPIIHSIIVSRGAALGLPLQ